MRHTLSRGSGFLAVAALVAVLVLPTTGYAQLGGLVDTTATLTDTTTALTDITTAPIATLPGSTTVLAGTGTLVGGTSDVLLASELTGSIPGLLTGEVLRAVTIGWPDQLASEASLAALDLNIAGINIGADFVMARALSVFGAAGVGISNIDNLSINGVPIPVTGDPNQTIGLPGGVLVIDERQVSPDGSSTVVNALHAIVYGVADVVVGSAKAGTGGGQASAVQVSY